MWRIVECSIALVALGSLCYAWLLIRKSMALRPFRSRSDQRVAWDQAFGDENAEAVERYLNAYCRAFDFPSRLKFTLRPDDRVNVYYDRKYVRGEADLLEHVSWIQELEEIFSVRFDEAHVPQGTTLGELLQWLLERQDTS